METGKAIIVIALVLALSLYAALTYAGYRK